MGVRIWRCVMAVPDIGAAHGPFSSSAKRKGRNSEPGGAAASS